MNKANNFI